MQNYLQAKMKYEYKRLSVTILVGIIKTKKEPCHVLLIDPKTFYLFIFLTDYTESGAEDTKMNNIQSPS